MTVTGVGILAAAALGRPAPTASVAVAVVAAAAILGAALLDLRMLRRRRQQLAAGSGLVFPVDPLDSWMNVSGLAALTLLPVFLGGAPSGLRVVLLVLGLSAIGVSWGGHRRHGMLRLLGAEHPRRRRRKVADATDLVGRRQEPPVPDPVRRRRLRQRTRRKKTRRR